MNWETFFAGVLAAAAINGLWHLAKDFWPLGKKKSAKPKRQAVVGQSYVMRRGDPFNPDIVATVREIRGDWLRYSHEMPGGHLAEVQWSMETEQFLRIYNS